MRRRLVGVCACWAVLLGCLGVFAAERPSSDGYVKEGLVAHWDAIDNTLVDGVRSHDPAATTWCDLTGNGSDVAIPSFVTVGANAMFSAPHVDKKPDTDATASLRYPTFTTLGGFAGDAGDPPFTVEVVARRGDWTGGDYYNLQAIFSTPRGAVGYRSTSLTDSHFYLTFPKSASQVELMDWRPSKDPTDIHVFSMLLGLDASSTSVRMDEGDPVQLTGNANYTSASPTFFSMFSNRRAEIYIHGAAVSADVHGGCGERRRHAWIRDTAGGEEDDDPHAAHALSLRVVRRGRHCQAVHLLRPPRLWLEDLGSWYACA